jgi:hypothetical protein
MMADRLFIGLVEKIILIPFIIFSFVFGVKQIKLSCLYISEFNLRLSVAAY